MALKDNKCNFNKTMSISKLGKEDILLWWMDNIMGSYNNIGIGNPTITITTNASKTVDGGRGGLMAVVHMVSGRKKKNNITHKCARTQSRPDDHV